MRQSDLLPDCVNCRDRQSTDSALYNLQTILGTRILPNGRSRTSVSI